MVMRRRQRNILIIKDEAAARATLALALQRAAFQVQAAEDVASALRIVAARPPDLILVAWAPRDSQYIDFIKQMKSNRHTQSIPLVLFTARLEEQERHQLMTLGVDDCILKPCSTRELVARLNQFFNQKPKNEPSSSQVLRFGELQVDLACLKVTHAGEVIRLSPAEYGLFFFFVQHRNQVYTRAEILSRVWKKEPATMERVVDIQIRRLRKALHPYGVDRFIQTVHREGYRFADLEE